MQIHEEVIYTDEKRVITYFEVPGGKIYRNVEMYFKKNQYGESASITFAPDSLLTRLTNWIKSWK